MWLIECPRFVDRFGSRYEAGEQAVRHGIVSFAAGRLINGDPCLGLGSGLEVGEGTALGAGAGEGAGAGAGEKEKEKESPTLTEDQALACLAQRIPLEFNPASRVAREVEMRLVESH